jgi:beta-glucosidase
VTFTVGLDELALVDESGRKVVAPGRYRLTVGGASPGPRAVSLGAPRPAEAILTVQ